MSRRNRSHWRQSFVLLLASLMVMTQTLPVWSGHQLFRSNSVGGVSIDTAGVLREPDLESRKVLHDELLKTVKGAAGDMSRPVGMRMVSLRGLEAAIAHANQHNLGQLPDEVKYLAGMQRVQYVFVDKEQNDVILAGPGEGWRVDDKASVVGITTGRPVIQLDDLLVAFRTVEEARNGGISCSIDPTEEGYRRLNQVLAAAKRNRTQNRKALEPKMKAAFGPQQISIQGVPATSHLARVIVAADYRMKRYAMGLEAAPVKGLPSFTQMIKSKAAATNVNPRWWMACNYAPLAKSKDGLSWELRGPGVKCMTENDFVTDEGQVIGTKNVDPIAQKWADVFTEKYDELCAKDAVFGELRNVMDLCVIAALIEKEGLLAKAGCSLPMITTSSEAAPIEEWHAPKTVEPQCSFLRTRSGWLVTASGGVQIESWQVASNAVVEEELNNTRSEAVESSGKVWWWN